MNNKDRKVILAGLLLSLLGSTPGWADDFYCGTHIITEGLSKGEVTRHCGQPSEQNGDTWVYERGPDQLNVELHFDGSGELERITTLDDRDD